MASKHLNAQELATQFLVHLQDEIKLDGIYHDPDLKTQSHPAQISSAMVRQVSFILSRIRWNQDVVVQFLGKYLTETKSSVFFDPPARPLTLAKFVRRAKQTGIQLDLKSLMLFHGSKFYLNGDSIEATPVSFVELTRLADQRTLPPGMELGDKVENLLYQWYCAGYIVLE